MGHELSAQARLRSSRTSLSCFIPERLCCKALPSQVQVHFKGLSWIIMQEQRGSGFALWTNFLCQSILTVQQSNWFKDAIVNCVPGYIFAIRKTYRYHFELCSSDIAMDRDLKSRWQIICHNVCVAGLHDLRLLILPQFRMGLDAAGDEPAKPHVSERLCAKSPHIVGPG